MTTTTARQEFQEMFRQALDTYHPRWEVGIKGKDPKSARQQFSTVACETLHDWVHGVKQQCPQQKSFQAFLDEAEFPEETANTIWSLYLAFKRGRRQRNQTRSSVLSSLEQFGEQSALPPLVDAEAATAVNDHDTMHVIAATRRKEYMHEHNEPLSNADKADKEHDWLTSKRRDMVEVSVANVGRTAIDDALKVMADARHFSPEECADIILGAFRSLIEDPDTREDIIALIKKRQSAV